MEGTGQCSTPINSVKTSRPAFEPMKPGLTARKHAQAVRTGNPTNTTLQCGLLPPVGHRGGSGTETEFF